jgi:hypothetical protein
MAADNPPEILLAKRRAAAAAEAAAHAGACPPGAGAPPAPTSARAGTRAEGWRPAEDIGGRLKCTARRRDRLRHGDDLKGRVWAAYEKRSGDGKCRAAELPIPGTGRPHGADHPTGIEFQAPAPETVGLDALTAETAARHFRNFVAAARAWTAEQSLITGQPAAVLCFAGLSLYLGTHAPRPAAGLKC